MEESGETAPALWLLTAQVRRLGLVQAEPWATILARLCRGSLGGDCPCYDFRDAATWRSSQLTMADFWRRARFEEVFVSKLWRAPGFTIENCIPDFMHCCCLGILQYLAGNIYWELFLQLGGNWYSRPGKQCGQLLGMITSMAALLDVEPPISTLAITMVRPNLNKPPKLKLKAAENRRMLPILRAMLRHCFPLQTEHEMLRYNCVDALNSVYQEMDQWNDDGTSTRRLRDFSRRHLLLYAELHKACNPPDVEACSLEWRLYPKHHLFAHISGSDNPKADWCYRMEAEVGKAAKIASRVNVQHMHRAFIARYRATYRV